MNSQQVSTKFFQYASSESPVTLFSGDVLSDVRVAYQTWGELNEDASNAILVHHALSGSHHLLGYNPAIDGVDLWTKEMHHGWWPEFVGPGKAIDTEKYFIICANYLGGCYGTTGPRSINPATGKRYGASFPAINVADQAHMMHALISHFGIQKLHSVVGASVGGLIALTFANLFPEKVKNVISIASGFKTTVLNKLQLFEQILAIENDPHFKGGDYYGDNAPNYGLALARMISHKTFVHLDAIERRAKSEVRQDAESLQWFKVTDPFQSYMLYQGKKFVSRFDANTYLRIIDMWSRYDAVEQAGCKDAYELFARSRAHGHKFLVFSIDSDFCFYPEEQIELVKHLEANDIDTMHITVHSDKGHDSFLLEPALYSPHIHFALERTE